MKAQRDLSLLEDDFEKKARAFLEEMKNIDEMKAHETLRTAERQAELRKTGKSRVLISNHQSGKAMDLHFVNTPNFPPAGHSRWKKAGEIAKKHGIDCGGILWGWDWNHFQDDGSKSQKIQTELHQKTLDAIIHTNSVFWNVANQETQNILEEANKKLRML